MNEPITIVRLRQPGEVDDPLTEVLRAGARRLLTQAIEAEVESFLASVKDEKLPDGRDRVVRHGHGPEREIQTGIGPVPVRRAKVRDRANVADEEKLGRGSPCSTRTQNHDMRPHSTANAGFYEICHLKAQFSNSL